MRGHAKTQRLNERGNNSPPLYEKSHHFLENHVHSQQQERSRQPQRRGPAGPEHHGQDPRAVPGAASVPPEQRHLAARRARRCGRRARRHGVPLLPGVGVTRLPARGAAPAPPPGVPPARARDANRTRVATYHEDSRGTTAGRRQEIAAAVAISYDFHVQLSVLCDQPM